MNRTCLVVATKPRETEPVGLKTSGRSSFNPARTAILDFETPYSSRTIPLGSVEGPERVTLSRSHSSSSLTMPKHTLVL